MKELLKCLALAFLCGFLGVMTYVVWSVPDQVRKGRKALVAEVQTTRTVLQGEIQAVRVSALAEIDKQATGLRAGALGQINSLGKEAFARLDRTLDIADRRTGEALERADKALGTVDALRADVKPAVDNLAAITGHVNQITQHVDDALPAFTDCAYLDENGEAVGGNQDCLFNRFQGVSKSFEKTMGAVSKVAPELLSTAQETNKQFSGIATDVHKVTTEFTRPKTFWQGVKDWLRTLARAGAAFL